MIFRSVAIWAMALASLPVLAAVREEIPSMPDISAPVTVQKKSPGVSGEPVSRGRMLYENHCTRCHSSVLHVRDNRRAVSLEALEGWARRWSAEEKLGWSDSDIIEVVDYLNRRYYKFPPPGGKK